MVAVVALICVLLSVPKAVADGAFGRLLVLMDLDFSRCWRSFVFLFFDDGLIASYGAAYCFGANWLGSLVAGSLPTWSAL